MTRSAFTLSSPHGRLVGVRLEPDGPDALEGLHGHPELMPEEAARAASMRGARKLGFVAGRIAAARALEAVGAPRGPIGSDARGAPTCATGFVVSISHKGGLGVALAAATAADEDGAPGARALRVGVDVEAVRSLHAGLERYVLTAVERARLPDDAEARALWVLAAFSVKEAIYKAIDPCVRRWVGYHEAELGALAPTSSGWSPVTATLTLVGGERIDDLEAFVTVADGHVLSTARARYVPAATRSSASSRSGV